MRDPRLDRLLLRKDETDSRGVPTRVSELAGKVSSTQVEIEKLRAEIEVASRQVMALAAREAALRRSLEEHSAKRPPSSGAVIGSNALALDAHSAHEFEDDPDFEFQQERLETISSNLKSRRLFVQRTQDLIEARLTGVQRMLDLFTRIEDGGTTSTRRRRRVRRIRRRR